MATMSGSEPVGWLPDGTAPTVTLNLGDKPESLAKVGASVDRATAHIIEKARDHCSAVNRCLLAIALMVRDEADTIVSTLESLIAVGDALVVLDTGSSDDTLHLIRNFCARKNWPCTCFEKRYEPFDFAAARNYLLQCCAESHDSEFIFLADAHDRVHGADYLRALCAEHVLDERGRARAKPAEIGFAEFAKVRSGTNMDRAATTAEAMHENWSAGKQALARRTLPCHYFLAVDFIVPVANGESSSAESRCATIRQPMVRLIRSHSGWRYFGPVHEILDNEWWRYAQRVAIPTQKCGVVQDKRTDNRGSQNRWKRDLRVLGQFLRQHPDHPQALYYCGKTHHALRNYSDAVQALAARLRAVPKSRDWAAKTQRHRTHYLLASCLFAQLQQQQLRKKEPMDTSDAVVKSITQHCWAAFALQRRVEPLLLLARIFLCCGDVWLMLAMTSMAMNMRIGDIDSSECHNVWAYQVERYELHQKALQLTSAQ